MVGIDGTALDVDAGDVPILGGRVTKTENTDVEVFTVRGSRSTRVGNNLGEWVGASREPETNGAAREVDIVGKVIPGTSDKVGRPLRHTANAPVELSEIRANSDLEFGKVRLEEEDLVLRGSWRIGGRVHDGEVIVHLTGTQVLRCLGDELGTHHGLSIPMRGRVDGQLETLALSGIGRVLVRGV